MKPNNKGSATNINDTDLTLSLSCLWLNSAATELVIKRQRLLPLSCSTDARQGHRATVCVCVRGWGGWDA